MKNSLSLARLASFLAFLFLFMQIGLLLALNDLLILDARGGIVAQNSLFNFSGIVLGSILCPLFLPLPFNRRRNQLSGIIFITLLILPIIILQSLGVDAYIASLPVRIPIVFLTGMAYPMCYGLFFLSRLNNKNHLARFCTFFFAIVLSAYYSIRFFSLPVLKFIGFIEDIEKSMSLLFNINRWLILGIGGAAITFIVLFNKVVKDPLLEDKELNYQGKTNWSMIGRLIGLAMVYRVFNTIMNIRLFPALDYSAVQAIEPVYIFTFLTIPVIALVSVLRPSVSIISPTISPTQLTIRRLLPPSIALFILFPCLPLFGNYPGITLVMDILGGVFNNFIWVFFSAAIVEAYVFGSPGKSKFKGFWFYGFAIAIHFTTVLALITYLLNGYIPLFSTEFTIILACITAVAFFSLSYRIIFSKFPINNELKQPEPANTSVTDPTLLIEEIFREHRLTEREMEVARLLVFEGLDNDQIANRIFRATITVKNHITSIYRKFGVKTRTEFMTLFVRK